MLKIKVDGANSRTQVAGIGGLIIHEELKRLFRSFPAAVIPSPQNGSSRISGATAPNARDPGVQDLRLHQNRVIFAGFPIETHAASARSPWIRSCRHTGLGGLPQQRILPPCPPGSVLSNFAPIPRPGPHPV